MSIRLYGGGGAYLLLFVFIWESLLGLNKDLV